MDIAKVIADEVMTLISSQLKEKKSVVPETEVMQMLGIESRRRMAELRRDGLRGHKVDSRHWVYFLNDVEEFVASREEE